MYKVDKSAREWHVINTVTLAIQSSWKNRQDAYALTRRLNRQEEHERGE